MSLSSGVHRINERGGALEARIFFKIFFAADPPELLFSHQILATRDDFMAGARDAIGDVHTITPAPVT